MESLVRMIVEYVSFPFELHFIRIYQQKIPILRPIGIINVNQWWSHTLVNSWRLRRQQCRLGGLGYC